MARIICKKIPKCRIANGKTGKVVTVPCYFLLESHTGKTLAIFYDEQLRNHVWELLKAEESEE